MEGRHRRISDVSLCYYVLISKLNKIIVDRYASIGYQPATGDGHTGQTSHINSH